MIKFKKYSQVQFELTELFENIHYVLIDKMQIKSKLEIKLCKWSTSTPMQ